MLDCDCYWKYKGKCFTVVLKPELDGRARVHSHGCAAAVLLHSLEQIQTQSNARWLSSRTYQACLQVYKLISCVSRLRGDYCCCRTSSLGRILQELRAARVHNADSWIQQLRSAGFSTAGVHLTIKWTALLLLASCRAMHHARWGVALTRERLRCTSGLY